MRPPDRLRAGQIKERRMARFEIVFGDGSEVIVDCQPEGPLGVAATLKNVGFIEARQVKNYIGQDQVDENPTLIMVGDVRWIRLAGKQAS
jgi:hypothetical protein